MIKLAAVIAPANHASAFRRFAGTNAPMRQPANGSTSRHVRIVSFTIFEVAVFVVAQVVIQAVYAFRIMVGI